MHGRLPGKVDFLDDPSSPKPVPGKWLTHGVFALLAEWTFNSIGVCGDVSVGPTITQGQITQFFTVYKRAVDYRESGH